MDIYYFYHPPGALGISWPSWNLAIPLKGSFPDEGDAVLFTNVSTMLNQVVWVGPQDELRKWPKPFPEKMMQHIISAIFKADYKGL